MRFSKRYSPAVIINRYMTYDDVVVSSIPRVVKWEHIMRARVRVCVCVRARRPALLVDAGAGADARWLSRCVSSARAARVSPSLWTTRVSPVRSRPSSLSRKQNRYKYNQMSNKVNKLKSSREEWMVPMCSRMLCEVFTHKTI